MDAANAGQLPETLQEAIIYFADPQHCHDFMVALRWPDGVSCPTCGRSDVRFIATRRMFECKGKHPRRQFSTKVGTIFEDSPVALSKWLTVVWLIANCKNGISSYEVARHIGVTQKTGWFMVHRIRLAMQAKGGGMLGGEVEIDETYIGGKARNMHKDKFEKVKGRTWAGKVAVMGLLQRSTRTQKSRVQTTVVPHTRRVWLQSEAVERVQDGSTVYTDELRSYRGLDQNYTHKVINHAVSYVDGNVHTNGIENFWSLLKRSIKGTYVSVEPFHLFRYLDEQAFRFNERDSADADRFVLAMRQIQGKRLTFNQLTARENDL